MNEPTAETDRRSNRRLASTRGPFRAAQTLRREAQSTRRELQTARRELEGSQ